MSTAKAPARQDRGRKGNVRPASTGPGAKPLPRPSKPPAHERALTMSAHGRSASPGSKRAPAHRCSPATLRAFSRALVALADDIEKRTDDRSAAALACVVRAAATLASAQRAAGTGLLVPVVVGGDNGDQTGEVALRWLPQAPAAKGEPEARAANDAPPALAPGHIKLARYLQFALEEMGDLDAALDSLTRITAYLIRNPQHASPEALQESIADRVDTLREHAAEVLDYARQGAEVLTGLPWQKGAATHATTLAELRAAGGDLNDDHRHRLLTDAYAAFQAAE